MRLALSLYCGALKDRVDAAGKGVESTHPLVLSCR